MKAEIIAVGSELLTPDRVDTNSLFLTAQLNRLGIEVTRKTVVGDELGALRDGFASAMERVELVIACGGLGPTEDDRTREAVADLLGRKLERSAEVMSKIEARFRQIGRPMSQVNARQALVPEGATVLDNAFTDLDRDTDGLARARLEDPRSGDSLTVHGIRQSGVSAETWRELGNGSRATAWNDSMFEFQQTPYDPRTLAGRIFLQRVRWIARTVGEDPGRVLEVGCEAGGLLRQLSTRSRIVGLDLSRAALKSARVALARNDIALVHADATGPLPFRDRSFDFVIASEVLEHCRSPHRVIAAMHAVLKDDGRAIISVPNERRYLRWKRWLRELPLARLALRGIEEGPAAWHIHHDFDRRKLAALVEGFFGVERETSIWGTTLISVLRKMAS